MSYNSKIEWTDATWNFLGGCSPCSPGCTNCAAAKLVAGRLKNHPLYKDLTKNGKWTGEVRLCTDIRRKDILEQPLHWRNPRMIFPCFMGDLFYPKVPFDFVLKVIGFTIATPWHTYLILTKRPDRMYNFFACWPDGWFIREGMKHSSFSNEFFAIDSIKSLLTEKNLKKANDFWKNNYDQSKRGKLDGPVPFPQPNLYFGVSISTPDEMWKATELLRIPAAVRFLSIEPMLGPIDLAGTDKSRMGKTGYLANYFVPFFCNHCGRHISKPPTCITSTCRYCGGHGEGHRKEKSIHGVVVGGESGPGARPMNPDWARSIRDQCESADVPFFMKQMGGHPNKRAKLEDIPEDLRIRELPERK